MTIQLETPGKYRGLIEQARQMAQNVLRPISRKYDRAEHSYPKELDVIAAVIDGMNSATGGTAGASHTRRSDGDAGAAVRNGGNLATVYSIQEVCWGDVGLTLSLPRQGLGNAAIAAVASDEQLARFDGEWVAMAITEPHFGSDSAAVRTTAVLEGDQWVLNGEKIYVTAGDRADALVVWATLDRNAGRAAIKPFYVPRDAPGLSLVRLEKKLGIRASDTAAFALVDCRIPKDNLLGSPVVDTQKGFGGVMQTFDNTRPLVAGMALGVARAALEETRTRLEAAGVKIDYATASNAQGAAAAAFQEMEADYESARLLTLKAAWMADNSKPNALQASMAKAKAGRMVVDVTLRCVELCGSVAYSEDSLLEKWARDSKILDIFEGTQQIQVLIVARRLLGKNSRELR